MSERFESTRVTFPAGATEGTSTVMAVIEVAADTGIITAETPFHPVDHTWPDQPADTGTLTVADRELAVVDCVTGARPAGGGDVLLGADISARRGDDAWEWFVVHVVEAPYAECREWVGAPTTLLVDVDRRDRLSACHTACHLMAFALNEALIDRWRKEVAVDSLGHPNFDAIAITSSHIGLDASTDTYRLGKSLRKKGFTVAATDGLPDLTSALDDIAATATARLNGWIATDAAVRVEAADSGLTAPRHWVCELPEGTATVMCGGTHVTHLAELGAVQVRASLSANGTELTVVTAVSPGE